MIKTIEKLKTSVDDLDVGKVKTLPVDLKKLSDVVDNEVVKNTKFNALTTKVNNLEKKISDVSIINRKKMEILIKKYQIQVV